LARKDNKFLRIYKALHDAYGPQGWWPGDSRTEVIIGAVLTQNTAWRNVEKAIRNLKREKLLSLKKLSSVGEGRLACLIRPSGYYNIKARRLKNLVNFLTSARGLRPEEISASNDIGKLREALLAVNGIGPETADSILLYAFGKPVFVVDAYTKRIFSRHRFFAEKASYDDVQKIFTDNLPKSARLFNEFHALIVRLGKDICRKKPKCGQCPLKFSASRWPV
jgi:endonuclease-3 related protein